MKTVYSIHPAIGIARIGDSGFDETTGQWDQSKASYFVGPETPGFGFAPQSYTHTNSGEGLGKYRNENDRKIRRQGARFRIYRKTVGSDGSVVDAEEITSDAAEITWTVRLANRKAAGERFPPYHKPILEELANHPRPGGASNYPNMVMRNFEVTGADRSRLTIESDASIAGASNAITTMNGMFLESPVKLADLMTDGDGRLIVLGGHGKSRSPAGRNPVEPHELGTVRDNTDLPIQLRRFGGWHRLYNWDGWCDDTSDGIVSAEVVLNGETETVPVDSAWVIVGPPDYAAAVRSPVTLYDLSYNAIQKAKRSMGFPVPSLAVSFTRDIYPILRRTVDLAFASDRARLGHSGDAAGNFVSEQQLSVLSSEQPDHQTQKVMFLDRLTRPGAIGDQIDMPDLYGGVDPNDPGKPPPPEALDNPDLNRRDMFGIPITLTDHQFELLERWANHNFEADWPGHEPPYPQLDDIEPAQRPAALDEAALEQCNGGSFHPGIEASFVTGRADTFRIDEESWFRPR